MQTISIYILYMHLFNLKNKKNKKNKEIIEMYNDNGGVERWAGDDKRPVEQLDGDDDKRMVDG